MEKGSTCSGAQNCSAQLQRATEGTWQLFAVDSAHKSKIDGGVLGWWVATSMHQPMVAVAKGKKHAATPAVGPGLWTEVPEARLCCGDAAVTFCISEESAVACRA